MAKHKILHFRGLNLSGMNSTSVTQVVDRAAMTN